MRDRSPKNKAAPQRLRLVPREGVGVSTTGRSDGDDREGTGGPPSPPPGDELHLVSEYLDGALLGERQDAFLEHLALCPRCQRALHAEVQLRDREEALRQQGRSVAQAGPLARPSQPAQPPLPSPVISLDRARATRPARVMLGGGALAGVAAAALALVVLSRREPGQRPVTLALAPERSLEPRLSWAGAAAYRPYHAMRGAAIGTGERLDPEDLARLARAKDCPGLAAAYLLSGELARAEQQYATCPPSLDLDADRAALAIERGDTERALELVDGVLAERPEHLVALWNRGLALERKGLGLTAAAAFDRVAQADPAWSAEASARARAARQPLETARESWRSALAAGTAMIPDGPVVPAALAHAVPARARLRFDDAVRTATTAARLDALRPLAAALEGRAGSGLLERLEIARKRLAPGRAALVPEYVRLFEDQRVRDPASWRAFRARARAAGADDLLLGAAYLARPTDPETARLAAAAGDPWLQGLVEKELANAALAAEDYAAVARHVAALEALCAGGAPRYVCLLAAAKRAEMSMDLGMAAQALTAAKAALEIATPDGEFEWRSVALFYAAEAHRLLRQVSAARAYYEEWALSRGDCDTRRKVVSSIAIMEVERGSLAQSQEILRDGLPRCDTAPGRILLEAQLDLMDAGLALDRTAWRRDLQASAQSWARTESDALFLEYLDLREQLAEQPLARARLRELAERARSSQTSVALRTRVEALRALFLDSTRRQRWDEALELAAASHDVARPQRCALALVAERYRAAAVLVAPDGSLTGAHHLGNDWAVPAQWRQRLADCERIDVIAFPPWGDTPLLDAALPWVVVTGKAAAPPASEAPQRALVVANSAPPAELRLPQLAPMTALPADATVLTGANATMRRAALAAADASLIEFHVHSAKVRASDAPALALTDSADGWALTAERIATWRLTRSPVVLLADCVGGVPAGYDHTVWGLPTAFRAAGARAVVASLTDIPDEEGGRVFAEIRERLRRDPNVARVVAGLRAEKISADPTSWVRDLVVFE